MLKNAHSKRFLFLVVVLILLLLMPSVVFAHGGKTDNEGGHFDDSTGEYHYHHGYPAHQHTDGECLYNFDDQTGRNSGTATGTTEHSDISEESDDSSSRISAFIDEQENLIVQLQKDKRYLEDEIDRLEDQVSNLKSDLYHEQESLSKEKASSGKTIKFALASSYLLIVLIFAFAAILHESRKKRLEWGRLYENEIATLTKKHEKEIQYIEQKNKYDIQELKDNYENIIYNIKKEHNIF